VPIIEKIFWLMAIGFTCVNAFILRSRAKAQIARNPELEEGYDKLFKGYLIFMNLPWLMMGIGIILGRAESLVDYTNPRVGNPYVIAFHLVLVVLWALTIFWIYLGGGAEFLVRHPGAFNHDIQSPLVVKLLFALMLFGGVIGEILMWTRMVPAGR